MWFLSKIWWVIPLGMIWFSFGGCGRESVELSYKAGLEALETGSYIKAAKHLQKAVDLAPQSNPGELARIHNHLGLAQWRAGNHDPAALAFKESKRLDERFFEPAYNLGLLHEEKGERDQAMYSFSEALNKNVNETRALEALGRMAIVDGDNEEALHNLEQARLRQPKNPRILTSMANVYLRDKQPSIASGLLKKALSTGEYPPALFNLARLFENRSDPANALEFYRRHIRVEKDPEYLAISRAAINRLDVYGEDPLAMAQTEGSRRPEPVRSPLAAPPPVQRPTPTPQAFAESKNDLLKAAETSYRQGKPNDAVGICLQAANHARNTGNPIAEEAALKKAVEYAPNRSVPHFALGQFYLRERNPKQAYISFNTAVGIKPTWIEAQLAKAKAALADDQFINARDAYEGAIAADPDNPDHLWNLCQLRLRIERKNATTRKSLETFVKRFPEDPRASSARATLRTIPKPKMRTGFRTGFTDNNREPVAEPPPPARHNLVSIRPVVANPNAQTGMDQADRVLADSGVGIGTFTSNQTLKPKPQAAVQLPTTPEGLYRHAHSLRRKKQFDQAAVIFEKAIELDPSFHEARLDLAKTYEDMREYDLARAYYYRIQRLDPGNLDASVRLGHLLIQQGDREGALQQFTRVVKLDPAESEAHFQLGQLLRQDPDRKGESRKYLTTFLELAPRDPRSNDARRWLKTL